MAVKLAAMAIAAGVLYLVSTRRRRNRTHPYKNCGEKFLYDLHLRSRVVRSERRNTGGDVFEMMREIDADLDEAIRSQDPERLSLVERDIRIACAKLVEANPGMDEAMKGLVEYIMR